MFVIQNGDTSGLSLKACELLTSTKIPEDALEKVTEFIMADDQVDHPCDDEDVSARQFYIPLPPLIFVVLVG